MISPRGGSNNAPGRAIIVMLLSGSGRVNLNTRQREGLEPVDKPVRLYEIGLFLVVAALYIAAMLTHHPTIEFTAAAATGLLIAICLWNLFVPPRFSATRSAFLCIGFLYLFLLIGSLLIRP